VKNDAALGAVAMADAIAAVLDTVVWAGLYSENATTTLLRVKLGPNSTGAFAERVTIFGGERPGTAGAAATSLLVVKSSDLGGRKGRGRMFIPAMSETDVGIGGQMDNGYLASALAILGDFKDAMDLADLPLVLLHNDATAPTLVTSLTPSSTAANQRRRQRRS
jgi:hypothetical protein